MRASPPSLCLHTIESDAMGKSSALLLMFASVLAGCAIAVQAPINAQLRIWLSSPWAAAFGSFVVGSLALGAVVLVSSPSSLRLSTIAASPGWVWLGGLLGAYFVLAAIVAAPRIGPALFFGLLVTGQLLTSLLLEHFGWLGLERQPISLGKVFGVLFLVIGAVLIRRF